MFPICCLIVSVFAPNCSRPQVKRGGPIAQECFSEGAWSLAMCGLELLSHPLLNCKLAEDWVCPGSLRCTVRPVGELLRLCLPP